MYFYTELPSLLLPPTYTCTNRDGGAVGKMAPQAEMGVRIQATTDLSRKNNE